MPTPTLRPKSKLVGIINLLELVVMSTINLLLDNPDIVQRTHVNSYK